MADDFTHWLFVGLVALLLLSALVATLYCRHYERTHRPRPPYRQISHVTVTEEGRVG